MQFEDTAQLPYRCRLEWGRDGVRRAAARGDVIIIVDTLRFSTAVTAAVARGAVVYPCVDREEVDALLRGGVGGDGSVMIGGGHEALSPVTYRDVQPGTRVLLPSPNGATCTRYGTGAPLLLVGALVNAEAVAGAISAALDDSDLNVTVVACGERRTSPGEDGPLRHAIEDYLGAGAILSYLPHPKSAEVAVCQAAFEGTRDRLAELLWESVSGRELREKGFGQDVEYAATLNGCRAVAVFKGTKLVAE